MKKCYDAEEFLLPVFCVTLNSCIFTLDQNISHEKAPTNNHHNQHQYHHYLHHHHLTHLAANRRKQENSSTEGQLISHPASRRGHVNASQCHHYGISESCVSATEGLSWGGVRD
ncbi:hypothetical protein E2C01_067689 [Portunus trituberculatus]|uniref:Uncharacterized protein n=1 Tax=Portunus trituberculatus TaxID=210409 RepID=A0A5B7HTJ1_PORTR|nr:hypothetical protein [Portunus trituberculatus]